MVKIKVNLRDLYRTLSKAPTGFVAWEATMTSGQTVAGLYQGYGNLVALATKPKGKGFGGEANVLWRSTNGPIEIFD